jgi:hypothetical protein
MYLQVGLILWSVGVMFIPPRLCLESDKVPNVSTAGLLHVSAAWIKMKIFAPTLYFILFI